MMDIDVKVAPAYSGTREVSPKDQVSKQTVRNLFTSLFHPHTSSLIPSFPPLQLAQPIVQLPPTHSLTASLPSLFKPSSPAG